MRNGEWQSTCPAWEAHLIRVRESGLQDAMVAASQGSFSFSNFFSFGLMTIMQ
jgi:hypothetical protein